MHTDTWTCEYCGNAYSDQQNYTNCRCEGMTAFRAGRGVPYSTTEHEFAAAEARERGMAFIVDGKHVNADRVFILSVPDTVGPISAMRTAKIDAQAALRDMEAFSANVSKPMNKAHVELTGQHLSSLMDAVGLEKKPHWDDTYLGMHSYITMSDIEVKVRMLISEMKALIEANNDLREVVHGPAVMKLEVKADPSVLKTFNECVALLKEGYDALGWQESLETENDRGNLMRRIENWVSTTLGDSDVVIDGIRVTDPELAAPITDSTPGVTRVCADCGMPFTDDTSSIFCPSHRQS
jgi:hypothetical protein